MRIANVSRRRFLMIGALAGGGLVLGVSLPHLAATLDAAEGDGTFVPNAFLRIGADESVTVIANHSEMGQGTYTSIAMLVADELEADWSRVRVESAPVHPDYNHPVFGMQITGGSTSTWTEYPRLRAAGAAARMMLLSAAAAMWGVEESTCRAEQGFVVHAATGRRVSYGKLADRASKLAPPKDVRLKEASELKLVGRETRRVDTAAKVAGTAQFGLDVNLPNMLVAVVARSPVHGGTLRTFDAAKAKAVPGVRHVIRIPRGVGVVADGFWPAKLGRDALELSWDEGANASVSESAQAEEYESLGRKPGAVARNDGDAAAAIDTAARKFEAVYDLPYLAHASMEPLNCVADVRAGGCDVWTGTQFQTVDRAAAAEEAGLPPEKVNLHTTFLGGGFGRRAVFDSHFVREAVQLSKAVGRPVKVVWTREDDTRGGHYRPRAHHRLRAGTDAAGAPVAWEQRIVCQSFAIGTPFEAFIVKDGVDDTAVEGAKELPYAIPNVRVEWHNPPTAVPVHFWRSVGHSHTAFVVESFLDELAHAAGRDPYEYRMSLLAKHERRGRILEFVAKRADWGAPLPKGHGRGIASHEAFGSMAAHVAEVSVGADGRPRVHRVVAAIDCGPIVNPDTVRAQLESAVVFALTAALYGEITLEKGRVVQRNFHDYPVLRMHECPVIEPHIVPSTEKMGGVGEPGVPSVAPAVCNALFAATGRRVRRLPIRTEDLR